jgi:hypothetical protein
MLDDQWLRVQTADLRRVIAVMNVKIATREAASLEALTGFAVANDLSVFEKTVADSVILFDANSRPSTSVDSEVT